LRAIKYRRRCEGPSVGEAMIKVCDKVEMGAETSVRASFAVKATCATQQRRGGFAMSL